MKICRCSGQPIILRFESRAFTLRSRAFTLIELLVVLGILTILVALLVPVVNGALVKSQRTDDANNLRQIGIAVHQYVSEHGVLPGRVNRGIRIPRTVADGDREKWLSTFLEDAGVVSPNSPMWESPSDYGANRAGTAYILNNTVQSEPPNFFGRRTNTASLVSQPLPLVGLLENVKNGEDGGRLSRIWLATNADGENYGSAGTGGSEHAIPEDLRTPWGGRNYVFFDGHVELVAPADYPSHN